MDEFKRLNVNYQIFIQIYSNIPNLSICAIKPILMSKQIFVAHSGDMNRLKRSLCFCIWCGDARFDWSVKNAIPSFGLCQDTQLFETCTIQVLKVIQLLLSGLMIFYMPMICSVLVNSVHDGIAHESDKRFVLHQRVRQTPSGLAP